MNRFRRREARGAAASPGVPQQASDEEELPAAATAPPAHDAPGKQRTRTLLCISSPVLSPQVGRRFALISWANPSYTFFSFPTNYK